MTAKKTPEEYGRITYDEYCAAVGGRSAVSGELLPTWEEMRTGRPDIARAWERAVVAVRAEGLKEFIEQVEPRAIAEAILTGRPPDDLLRPVAEAYMSTTGWRRDRAPEVYAQHRTNVMQQGWMHAIIVAVLRMVVKPKDPCTEPVDTLAVRVLQEHLLVGPRPGQCLCGWGDESMPVRFLGRPHGEHVARVLREAGVLKGSDEASPASRLESIALPAGGPTYRLRFVDRVNKRIITEAPRGYADRQPVFQIISVPKVHPLDIKLQEIREYADTHDLSEAMERGYWENDVNSSPLNARGGQLIVRDVRQHKNIMVNELPFVIDALLTSVFLISPTIPMYPIEVHEDYADAILVPQADQNDVDDAAAPPA